jgi:hypothetical protein
LITTGSKFLFGTAIYGIVATFAYALASDYDRTGVVTLGTLAGVALVLGFIVVAFRDGEVATAAYPDGMPEDEATTGPGPLVSPSVFPILGAFGVAVLLIGLAFSRWFTIFGAVILAAVVIEWTIQAWSDRASDDAEYNRSLRNRLMQPIEFPVLGALAVGLVIFGFSRVMLAVSKNASIVLFIVIAGLVLAVAAVFAGLRRIGGEVLIGTLLVGGIIVLTAGVIGAVRGERDFHAPEGEGANTESVANIASIAARFELDERGLSPTNVTFTHQGGGPRQLVLEPAEGLVCADVVSEEPEECASAFVEDGQTTFLTFQYNLPGTYTFVTQGADGTDRIEGTIVVS